MVEPDFIDAEELRSIRENSAGASTIFEDFAERENNQKTTKVETLMNRLRGHGHNISRHEVVWLFRRLQELGCGTFIVGRRGQPSRFSWDVSLRSVGQVATGESDEVEEDFEVDDDEAENEDAGIIEHAYRVRPAFELRLNLPEDLTAAEAERIATFVKTLPFSTD